MDICAQIDSVPYDLAAVADLAETVAQVEALDRRIVSAVADVRDPAALLRSVEQGVTQLDGIDIALANAGILGVSSLPDVDENPLFRDVIEVNLTGVWNTVSAAAPVLIEQGRRGSVVLTSSVAGLSGRGGDGRGAFTGYQAAKHGVVGLMRSVTT